MKFSHGAWLDREGFQLSYPSEVYTYEQAKDSLVLYLPFVKVLRRGHTLDGGMLTVTLSSPMENVIRVQAVHHLGYGERGPHHAVNIGTPPVQIVTQDQVLSLQSGQLRVEVPAKDSYSLTFFDGDKKITSSDPRGLSYIIGDDHTSYLREQLSLDVGELIYGLGERFGPFVKNGQTVDIWNEDGGTSTEQAYKNIPFYLSNKGYGVFVNHLDKLSYEVASEKNTQVQFSLAGEKLDYFIINGPTLEKVLTRYTDLLGKPALPPAWSFGLWLSTSFTTSYDEATIMSFIDGMGERDIPFEVFHFDCFWMKAFEWCNFTWDEQVFPDPRGMLERIKAKGLKTCLWINPYIGQKSPLFKTCMALGYLLKRPDGSVWQWDKWQAGLAVIDFTNPQAVQWYQEQLAQLMDMGIDSFKTDFGERIPIDVIYHDGSCPHKMHNYYAYLYNQVVFELLETKRGKGDAVVFARSAAAGAQQFPVHWGGDCWSTYPSMAESLRGGLSFSLSGFSYWSHDISGFEQGASPDLYKRWTQFGLLSSHSRYHGNTEYKVPWTYDDEAVTVTRKFSKLKNSLMPYLWRNAVQAAQTGVPMMRPMVLSYTNDETCHHLDRQYMLGDSLLVAPIFNDQGTVRYYAPAGQWTNLLTNQLVSGEKWHNETHGYLSLPLLVPENTILPIGSIHDRTVYDYTQEITFHLFEVTHAVTTLYTTDGQAGPIITAKRTDTGFQITLDGYRGEYTLVLRHVATIHKVSAGVITAHPLGVSVVSEVSQLSIIL